MTVREFSLPKHFYFVILLMVPLTGMGIDLYSPSLPWIVSALHTTKSMAKLTIPMYLVGYAIGPLAFGLMSDSVGRKVTASTGLGIYLLTCLLIIFIPNIWVMLVMRVIQGIGISAISITFRSLVSDTLPPGPKTHKFTAIIVITWSTGPIIAPFIGGYLQHYFGWQANFVFLFVYGLALLLLLSTIPETIASKQPFSVSDTLASYKTILSHPLFWAGGLLMGIVYSFIVFFNVVGPFLIQDVLGYTPIAFGHIALIMGFAFFLGGISHRRLLKTFPLHKLIPVNLCLMMITVIVMLILALTLPLMLWAYCITTFLSLFFLAAVFPAGMSRCISLFPHISGRANAMAVFIFCTFTAIAMIVASYLHSKNMIPVAIAYVILGFVLVFIYISLMHRSFKAE